MVMMTMMTIHLDFDSYLVWPSSFVIVSVWNLEMKTIKEEEEDLEEMEHMFFAPPAKTTIVPAKAR